MVNYPFFDEDQQRIFSQEPGTGVSEVVVTLSMEWDIAGLYQEIIGFEWDVAGLVTNTLPVRWNVASHIATDLFYEEGERSRKILEYFPRWMQPSQLIKDWSIVIANEVTSRVDDLFYMSGRQVRPSTSTELGLPYWQEMLGVPFSSQDSIELKRAKIFSKTVHGSRLRPEDMANIIRFYLSGLHTFVSAQVNNSKTIRVRSLDGFVVGQQIYVGAFLTRIEQIRLDIQALVVEDRISVPAYTLIATSLVEIEEDYGNYLFIIRLDSNTVLDLPSMIDAIERTKPAHLNYQIVDIFTDVFLWENSESTWESAKKFGPKVIR